MINFNTMGELIAMAEEKQLPIHEIVIAREMHVSQRSREAILDGMKQNWTVMQASIERGIKNTEHSVSGREGIRSSCLRAEKMVIWGPRL